MTVTTHSPAKIAARFLIAQGTCTLPSALGSWPVYVGFQPDGANDPNDVVTIYDTAGLNDGRLMTGEPVTHPGIQVRVRAEDYDTGWAQVKAIAAVLNAATRADTVVIGSSTYTLQNINQAGPPFFLGVEEGSKRREQFTINYLTTLKEA